MFVKYNLSQTFSTLILIFVIIYVHFVKSLDEVIDKTSTEEQPNKSNTTTDKLEVESSYRRTRLLTDFPAPIYVPQESKKSKKSTKSKKKKKYEKDTEDDAEEDEEEEEECDDEGEGNGKASKKSQKNRKNKSSTPRSKPIIKYVPIPIYLNPPKPKTTTPSPYGLMNSISFEDLISMKNMMSNTGGYGLMGMTKGSMPMNFGQGMGYNPMDLSGLGMSSYGLSGMSGSYGPMANSGGSASYGKQNQNYVVANYANKIPGSSAGNSDYWNGNNKEKAQYENYQDNSDSDNGYKNNNNSVNKTPKQKSNTNSKSNRRPKKRPPMTTTTTEEPTHEQNNDDPSGEEYGEQYGDNDAKAKQISKMLEMLDKWN